MRWSVAIATLSLLASSASAQTAAVFGVISNYDAVFRGGYVEAVATKCSMGERRAAVDENGRFALLGLQPCEKYSLTLVAGDGTRFQGVLPDVRAGDEFRLEGVYWAHCMFVSWRLPDAVPSPFKFVIEKTPRVRMGAGMCE